MEAVNSSKPSVNFYQIWCHIPHDSTFQSLPWESQIADDNVFERQVINYDVVSLLTEVQSVFRQFPSERTVYLIKSSVLVKVLVCPLFHSTMQLQPLPCYFLPHFSTLSSYATLTSHLKDTQYFCIVCYLLSDHDHHHLYSLIARFAFFSQKKKKKKNSMASDVRADRKATLFSIFLFTLH
jgi:hypothetical protein